ncbi:MAG: hypothetical protein WD850_01195 [Candidatus Spechtbacterales bacterium]
MKAKKPFFLHRANRKTVTKVLILALATPIILSSPAGTRVLTRQLGRELTKRLSNREDERLSPENVRQTLYKIKSKGYYRPVIKPNGRTRFELTIKGERLLKEYQFADMGPVRPVRWDGRWHFVSFDIPQKASYARDIFRDKLKRMGFFQVQQSLWVYPYECKREIDFIIDFLHIERYVFVFRTTIEEDKRLREYFQKRGFEL